MTAGRTRARLWVQDRSGSAAIEFAMIAPIFVGLLVAIFEIGLVFFAGQTLETGAADAARLVMTGQAQKMTVDQFKAALCPKISMLFDCNQISVDIRAFDITPTIPPAIVAGKLTTDLSFQTGGAGQIVVVRVFYQWPLLVTGLGFDASNLAGNKRLLTATASFRNEPF